MWRWFAGALGAALVTIGAIVAVRTATYAAPAPVAADAPDLAAYAVDADAAAAHLAAAIGFRTVSLAGAETDEPDAFAALHAWLAETYPAFHAAARREVVGAAGLLYVWDGADAEAAPILLLAHQDVVPVPEDTRAAWSAAPFGGEIRDGHVWGRGALDDKASLVALFEAAELVAAAGRAPARTIVFALGHDEELGGEDGAQRMAALMAERGVRAWFALDEGMAVVREHPITAGPAALIGVAEKGFGTLRVVAAGAPGHSSMPPPETAVSTLAEAVTRIHKMEIARSLAGAPAEDMLRALAPQMSLTTRTAVANEWLFGLIVRAQLAESRAAQALIGTTVAPTVIAGGERANVLPGQAQALINLRFHPRDAPETLLARARAAVAGLDGVSVDWAEPPLAASPISRADSESFALIAALSRALLPDAPVAPAVVLGGTDARHYAGVAEDVYRFQPVLLGEEDWQAVHGVDERISIENLERLVRFYAALMEAGT